MVATQGIRAEVCNVIWKNKENNYFNNIDTKVVGTLRVLVVTHGQCNAYSVTFPVAEHHRPLAGTNIYCLVSEADGYELAQSNRVAGKAHITLNGTSIYSSCGTSPAIWDHTVLPATRHK